MQAFLAIVADTWRQSKQQWVFLILLVMLGAVTLTFAALTKVHDYGDGAESRHSQTLLWSWQDAPEEFSREDHWEGVYSMVIAKQQGREEILRRKRQEQQELKEEMIALSDEYSAAKKRNAPEADIDAINERAKALKEREDALLKETDRVNSEMLKEARAEVKRRSADISDLQKALEITLAQVTTFLTILTMLGFVAAASGYFPGLIAQGSVDSVLARPVNRLQVFFGKYVGGLALISAALFACWLALFITFGIKTGLWHWHFFSALPMTLLAAALLYAIVAWVGLMTRSTALSLVTGYFFYLVVDTAVHVMVTQAPNDPLFADWKWLVTMADWGRYLVPNFRLMRESAEASVVNVPVFEAQPLIVAFAWLVILLVTAFRRFQRTDF